MTTTDKYVIETGKDRDGNAVLIGQDNRLTVPNIRAELVQLHATHHGNPAIRNLRDEKRLRELGRWQSKGPLAKELASARRAVFGAVGKPARPGAQGHEAWTWTGAHRKQALEHELLGHGARGRGTAKSFTVGGVAASAPPPAAPAPPAPQVAPLPPVLDAAQLNAELSAPDLSAARIERQLAALDAAFGVDSAAGAPAYWS